MKKHTKSLVVALFTICVLVFMSACFNPMGLDPAFSFHITGDITGDMTFTDITAAVLLLTNLSKSINVTEVSIDQPDWAPNSRVLTGSGGFELSFKNKPASLERKAVYVNPSEHNYRIKIDYQAIDGSISGSETLSVPLPLPRQLEEVMLFRDEDGNVIIEVLDSSSDWELTIYNSRGVRPHRDDTGRPSDVKPDPLLGEGSSPAVIPPDNRTRMATFVVINRTNIQAIDSVNFAMSNSDYTIGTINANDRQSIALGQGTWSTTVNYTQGGTNSIGPRNIIIVPSNDPQAIREHYLYFYRNNRDTYSLTQEWPPDDLHPNDFSDGLTIVNQTSYMINNVELTDAFQIATIATNDFFVPSGPINASRQADLDIFDSEAFPEIVSGQTYDIKIFLEGVSDLIVYSTRLNLRGHNTIIVTVPAQPGASTNHDNPEKIVAPPEPDPAPAQVTVNVRNLTTTIYPGLSIEGVNIKTASSTPSRHFASSTWTPAGLISQGGNANLAVLDSALLPFTGNQYRADIWFSYDNKSYSVGGVFFNAGTADVQFVDKAYLSLTLTDTLVATVIPNPAAPPPPEPPPTPPTLPPYWYVPETVIRIYGIGITHSPTAIIFVEDYFNDAQVSAPRTIGSNYDLGIYNGSNDHLRQTGRTNIQVSSNQSDFNGISISGSYNRFRDNVLRAQHGGDNVKYWGTTAAGNVIELNLSSSLSSQLPNHGEIRESGGPIGSKPYIDIRLPEPTKGNNGWWIYHRTGGGTNWVISYTQAAQDAPLAGRHYRFWVGASLMDPDSPNYSVVRVNNNPFEVIGSLRKPQISNTGTPVLPIGIHQYIDTTSIMRPSSGLATTTPSGRLHHTGMTYLNRN
ncbi:MAG: hypothetical protein FWH19_01310 [Treponema sp.]|nr:hypothetical protein [Treponema sp.]